MAAVVLMTAALTAGVANAQSTLVQGKFSLPVATYWGNTVLPAGDYSFTIRSKSEKAHAIDVRGAGKVQHMALGIIEDRTDGSALTLVNNNGVAVARTLYIAEMGRVFHLPAAKATKEMLANSDPSASKMSKVAVQVAAE